MKKFITLFALLLGCMGIYAQETVHTGNAYFDTQLSVDTFSNQYTKIDGKLQITGDVTDLTPLGNIDTVTSKFDIYSTTALVNLDGLNVTYAGSNLYFADNALLEDIDGLSALTFIGKDLVFLDNDVLTNLDGLSGVDTIKRNIVIGTEAWNDPPVARGNDLLASFCGLYNVLNNENGHQGDYTVENNAANPSKEEIINNIACTVHEGNVYLDSQDKVDRFSSQYKKINGKLQITGDVTDLTPLGNIDTVTSKFDIYSTTALVNLDGLNVTYAGSNLYFADNALLEDIDGLSALTFIGKDLVFLDNDVLTNLDGLSGVDTIKRNIVIGTEAWNDPPVARGNDLLASFCGLYNVLNNENGHQGDYSVENNAANPSKEEIINNIACTVHEGNVYLDSQNKVDRFSSQYTKINGKLQLTGDVTDLTPLGNIDTVTSKFDIYSTTALVNLDGLNVTYAGSNLYFADNVLLENIDGLSGLAYIGKDLVFLDNDVLTNLDGLSGVDTIKRNIVIGTEAWNDPPVARGNDLLASFCGLYNVLNNENGHQGDYTVENNAANPSKEEILANCGTIIKEMYIPAQMSVRYVAGDLRINMGGQKTIEGDVYVYSITGSIIAKFDRQYFSDNRWESPISLRNNTLYIISVVSVDQLFQKSS